MTDLLSTTFNWLSIHWGAALGLAGGGAALSILVETFLNTVKINSKKLAYTTVHVLGAITAVATYLLANLPTTDVPAVYGSIVILAQTWHRFVISPAYSKFIVPYLNFLAEQKATQPQPATPTVPSLPETESDFETQ